MRYKFRFLFSSKERFSLFLARILLFFSGFRITKNWARRLIVSLAQSSWWPQITRDTSQIICESGRYAEYREKRRISQAIYRAIEEKEHFYGL